MARTVRLTEMQRELVLRALGEILDTDADGPPYMSVVEVAELFEARALIADAKEEDET